MTAGPVGIRKESQDRDLEARLTWRFAGAMLAQTLAILGGVLAILRLLE